MTEEQIQQSFDGWKVHAEKGDNYYTIKDMEQFYRKTMMGWFDGYKNNTRRRIEDGEATEISVTSRKWTIIRNFCRQIIRLRVHTNIEWNGGWFIMNTYILCKVSIKNANYKNQEEKDGMQLKLDVFLLFDRMTQSEYEELVGLLGDKPVAIAWRIGYATTY